MLSDAAEVRLANHSYPVERFFNLPYLCLSQQAHSECWGRGVINEGTEIELAWFIEMHIMIKQGVV